MQKKTFYLIIGLVLMLTLVIVVSYETSWFRDVPDAPEPAITESGESPPETQVADVEEIEVDEYVPGTELVREGTLEERTYTTLNLTHQYENKVEPDQATITMAVESRNSDLDVAYETTNTRIEEVLTALEEYDLTEVSTLNFQIRQYDEEFQVTNRIQVVLSDLEILPEVVNAGVESGINRIQGINFSLADPEEVKAATTREAISSLEARIERIIGEFGSEEYHINHLDISENRNVIQERYQADVVRSAGAAAMPSFEPGEISISTQIQAEIEFYPISE